MKFYNDQCQECSLLVWFSRDFLTSWQTQFITTQERDFNSWFPTENIYLVNPEEVGSNYSFGCSPPEVSSKTLYTERCQSRSNIKSALALMFYLLSVSLTKGESYFPNRSLSPRGQILIGMIIIWLSGVIPTVYMSNMAKFWISILACHLSFWNLWEQGLKKQGLWTQVLTLISTKILIMRSLCYAILNITTTVKKSYRSHFNKW